jgi:hypothetical protein
MENQSLNRKYIKNTSLIKFNSKFIEVLVSSEKKLAFFVFPKNNLVNPVLQYRGLASAENPARTVYKYHFDRLFAAPPPPSPLC